MPRSHNFSGGPGALPDSVLEETQAAIRQAPGTALSLLGLSHRSPWFDSVINEAEAHFRALLNLPSDYHVLFLQGGSTLQFAQIPMTLLRSGGAAADYLHTGYWSGKSLPEAQRQGPTRIVWSGEGQGFRRLPKDEELPFCGEAPYLHYVSNETVEGLQFHRILGRDDVCRICDMSSDFLSRPIEVSRFGLIYAHAQKNLGPSGVTVVIVRDDIVRQVPDGLPSMLDYRCHVGARSVYNTPPVFAIYVTMLVARWLRHEIGGLERMGGLNAAKAARLYAAIDGSGGYYRARAAAPDRSQMNVVFNLPTAADDARFLRVAEAAGFYGLEGHRTLGGIRASIYNAVTPESVDALIGFMRDFQGREG
ncbi:MAG TPA: 3-phosphoserine/phosphohydroxythreonine transaminase [Opitutaceae bacterium]|nr:3-phosphoserine/phosphohydroxythreonine transaminase [Opitutaceae bacterium]